MSVSPCYHLTVDMQHDGRKSREHPDLDLMWDALGPDWPPSLNNLLEHNGCSLTHLRAVSCTSRIRPNHLLPKNRCRAGVGRARRDLVTARINLDCDESTPGIWSRRVGVRHFCIQANHNPHLEEMHSKVDGHSLELAQRMLSCGQRSSVWRQHLP